MIEIIKHLQAMEGKYIALSLYPGNSSIIEPEGNILYINEGRGGKFDNVSEVFYDQLVDMFDSRYKNKLK